MNHQEIINEVTKLTNIDSKTCEQVIQAFESNSTLSSVMGSFFGSEIDVKGIATKIANKTGIDVQICEQILTVMTSAVKKGIQDKFKF